MNLNKISIITDGEDQPPVDNSITNRNALISIYFRNQKEELLKLIQAHNTILGCVAWFTDHEIIKAMAGKFVSIVVQKEDFLRLDINGDKRRTKSELRKSYDLLRNKAPRHYWPGLIRELSYCCEATMYAVRCAGNHNSAKAIAHPRMHNKFLIFGDRSDSGSYGDDGYGYKWDDHGDLTMASAGDHFTPKKVWTGSYNMSLSASFSFENCVVIDSDDAAWAYYAEFSQIYAISEPLDWESEWVAPEYRIGT